MWGWRLEASPSHLLYSTLKVFWGPPLKYLFVWACTVCCRHAHMCGRTFGLGVNGPGHHPANASLCLASPTGCRTTAPELFRLLYWTLCTSESFCSCFIVVGCHNEFRVSLHNAGSSLRSCRHLLGGMRCKFLVVTAGGSSTHWCERPTLLKVCTFQENLSVPQTFVFGLLAVRHLLKSLSLVAWMNILITACIVAMQSSYF